MSDKVIVYHEACKDGFCAMCVAMQKFNNDSTIPTIPISYGREADVLANSVFKNKEVYFVDFGLKKDKLDVFSQVAKSITILDHHDTFLQEYINDVAPEDGFLKGKYKNANLVMDMNRSGALITWDYLYATPAPPMVNYISDDDLFRFNLKDTRAFISRLMTQEMDFDYWQSLLNANTDAITNMIREGTLLDTQYDALCNAFANNMQRITITIGGEVHEGHAVLCAGDRGFKSRVGEMIYNKNHSFAVVIGTIGNEYSFSLRAANPQNSNGVPSYNVKAIAEYFHGGGHYSAAGCSLTAEQFAKHVVIHDKEYNNKLKL